MPTVLQVAYGDNTDADIARLLGSFREQYSLAQVYNAYHLVHEAAGVPFSTAAPATLFHASHFLLARIMQVSAPESSSQQILSIWVASVAGTPALWSARVQMPILALHRVLW